MRREIEHERLREAFPGVDIDGATAIADKERNAQTQPTLPPSSGSVQPRPNPRRRLIAPHREHALRRLHLVPGTPPRDEGARGGVTNAG